MDHALGARTTLRTRLGSWFRETSAIECGPALAVAVLLVSAAHSVLAGSSDQAAKPPITKPAVGTVASPIKGAYFGEALPGETPVPFAPNVLNAVSPWVAATEFSPDGTQFFLSVGTADYSGAKLYYSKRVNDVWTPLAEARFASDFTFSHEPVFSADGAALTFTGKKAAGSIDLWTVRYTERGWGTPVALPAPINSEGRDFRGSTMSDGTMYFGSNRSGMMQVFKAYEKPDHTLVAELLGAPINARSYEGDPCVAPDGHYLIFYSGRDGRSSDLYVSFRDAQGAWGPPVNLGSAFNTPADEYGAHLSSDGKYLFFTRHSAQGDAIYWVAASAIEKLKT